MKKGKFEIFKTASKTEPWRWRLKSANGRIICQSEGYQRKSGCLKGIHAVQAVASSAEIQEVSD